LNEDEKRERVSEIPIFNSLDSDLANALANMIAKIGTERILDTDEDLYSEGSSDLNTGAILLAGAVRVRKANANEIEVSAPSLLGEMQQYEPTFERTATVSAAEECVVLEFQWHDFVFMAKELLSREDQVRLRETLEDSIGIRVSEFLGSETE
jgi:hypothetical protein